MGLVHVQNNYVDQFHYTPDDRDADKLEVLHLNLFSMIVFSLFQVATMIFVILCAAKFTWLWAMVVSIIFIVLICAGMHKLLYFLDEKRTLQDYGL
jgi:hypothetical protein